MRRPVLIVGVEPRITIPIARSLHRHGIPVDIASLSASEHDLRSRAVSNFVHLPESGDQSPRFLEKLTSLISQRNYDMLIPVTDAALAIVSVHSARLRELLHVACPPPQVVERVLNKSLTLQFARTAGVFAPETYYVSSASELDAISNKIRFPVVAKPSHKSSETDFKVRYFQRPELLRQALTDDDKLGSRILLQEFASGDGVGVEVLMHDSEPVAVFQHRRLKEVPATGGAAAVAIAESPQPALVNQALALLRALEWEGIAMVEFRYDRKLDQSALMEVNGRYWGSVALPLLAGMDFPLYEWRLAHGEPPEAPTSYAVGTKWRWTAGCVRRFHDMLPAATSRGPARDLLFQEFTHRGEDRGFKTRDALFSRSDPMPAIIELFRTVKKLAVSDGKRIRRALGPVRVPDGKIEKVRPPTTKV